MTYNTVCECGDVPTSSS